MIGKIVNKFQTFRNRLFRLFPYRASATMDLIDAVASSTGTTSVVKLSLSDLFRRQYSSITDALDSLFRSDLKQASTREDTKTQTLRVTQLLAEECFSSKQEGFALFAIDCTTNSRIYATKVSDRTIVHAPNRVPGQKPITVGHEYSVLVHLPDEPIDRQLHWVVPLSVRRVESHETGPKVGLAQLEKISHQTVFKDYFCVNVSDAAYSTRAWVIGVSKLPQVVHITRMRGNRKVYRVPPLENMKVKGRPLLYGEEILLSSPSQPDFEEVTTITTRKGKVHRIHLKRWNDVIMQGSDADRTHEHPFDLLRVTVIDKKGKTVYPRPLWVAIMGARRKEIKNVQAYAGYCRRFDIEHFFRFGKQRLGLVNSQTCETRHEENWHWIGLLAYNMLYHARQFSQTVVNPWEKHKVHVVASKPSPSQVQRDFGRLIRGIGTPAAVPKPRGKSLGRRPGTKSAPRPLQPLIGKSQQIEERPSKFSSRAPSIKTNQQL